MSQFNGNQPVKINTGKYEGLVGSCIESRDDTEMVKLQIVGVNKGVEVNETTWLKYAQCEAL